MQDTIPRYLSSVPDVKERSALQVILNALADRLSSLSLISAGLVIKAGGGVLTKTGGSAWYGLVQGKLVTKGSATDMAALSGTVTNAKFNVYCFYIDSAGTLTSAMGTEGATIGAVVIPVVPVGKTMIGFIIVNPTGTGNFVGNTTALDDATVVPNVVYVNSIGPTDASILL